MKAKDLIIPFLATILQYYDYALFGLSASRIAKSYLPGNDLLTFFAILTFAVVMRPVGSVLFGFVGDKRGRSVILKISIFLASVSTLIIGIIPASQNIYSAVLLILARMIFMMSLAGEIDSVRIYVAESIGKNREFLGNGIVTASSQIGVAVASFAVFLSDMVGGEFWRVSFIFGGVVGLIISIFARNIPESSEFLFNKAKDDVKPSFTILIFGILISGFIGGIYHFYMIFFKSYITDVTHLIESDLFGHILILGVILYILAAIISGYIADKFCEKKQIAFSLVVSIILAIANAIYMANGEVSGLLLVLSIFLIAFYSVPLQIILKRKMPIGNRLKLFSLSHSLGSLIFSSSSTLISTFIYDSTHLAFMPMFYLIAMMLVLGGVSFFCFRIPSLEC